MPSEDYERRNRRARERGFRNYYEMRKLGGAAELAKQSESMIGSLPGEAYEVRQRSLEAVGLMRQEGMSLSQAADRVGVSSRAVKFWAGVAFEGNKVRPGDRLLRIMNVITDGQVLTVPVRGNHQSSVVSAHWQAVARFLETADATALSPFRGKSVAGYPLETDPDVLERLALAGPLQFEDIYALAG